MKAHLTLMVFRGRVILCLDAIETAVSMREASSDHVEHKSHLFELRLQILQRVMDIVVQIARDTWVDTVIVEEFSNTIGVREALKSYPQVCFGLHELTEIYDWEVVDSIFHRITQTALRDKKTEIQLLNTNLQDKWLRSGVNSARILMGSPQSIMSPLRGI